MGTPARQLFGVLLVGACLVFYNLGGGSLKDWDEAFTAERAREILVLDDWVTLHWNYRPDFVKPPLYYWLTALTYSVIGPSELAARLWSAIFGLLGLYAVYRLGKTLFSASVGVVAAGLLLTVAFYVNSARTAMLDTALLSFGVLALCAFLSQSFLVGWALLGAGFLLKGPWVALYLLAVPLWWATQHRWESLRNPRLYIGAGLFVAIVLPWHLAQWYWHGQPFLDSYVGGQIVRRMREPIEGHRKDALFYLMRVSDKWHVWTYWCLVGHAIVRWRGEEGRKLAFLDLWLLATLLILTFLIQTKLTEYSLALYPAFAVAVATFVVHAIQSLRWWKPLLLVSCAIGLPIFFYLYDRDLDFNPNLKEIGAIVERHATESSSVVALRTLRPAMVFYCRRPVRAMGRVEEIASLPPGDVFLILDAGSVLPALTEQGSQVRPLYRGTQYALVLLPRVLSIVPTRSGGRS